MENANDIKTRSIRADSESFEKFKLIAEQFPNQAQALEALISVYEIEKSKSFMPERKSEIETFAVHTQKINEIYNHALLINMDAETRIRAEFERQLTSKDLTIQELQERIKTAEINVKEANTKLTDMQTLTEKIKGMETELEKNNSIIKSLTEITDEYKAKAKESDNLKATIAKLEKHAATADKLKIEIESIKVDNEKNIKRIEEHKDLEKDKVIVALEREHNQKINELHLESKKMIEEFVQQLKQPTQEHEQPIPIKTPRASKKKIVADTTIEAVEEQS